MNFKNNEKRKENNDKAGRLDTRKVVKNIVESIDIMASLLHTFFNKICIRSRESA